MVSCHGSQCGFCTRAFVMSLVACYESHQATGSVPTRQQLADALAGNLCRCTGYRPIPSMRGSKALRAPPQRLHLAPVEAALRQLAAMRRWTCQLPGPHQTFGRTGGCLHAATPARAWLARPTSAFG